MKTPDENILEFRNAFITTSFLDLKTTKIVIKLNIVTIAPFCFPRSRPYDSVTKRLHEKNLVFFFVASKNAWRGTLDSKTQTKERKWVSCDLLKFILGSGAEGNKTGTRKRTRNLWFPRNRISYDFTFLLNGSKKTVVSIRTRKNLLSGDLFSEKVGGRLPNKKERPTAWSQVKPQFATIRMEQKRVNVVLQDLKMRSIDKNKNIKTTKTKTLSFVQLWPNCERRGKIMVRQVCLLLRWSLICLTKLPLS